ncbi:MAG: hypothetical protein H0V59_08390 [Nocardioidaceae bacterium]|nr:hypothetical protein [Nocardioidaceae bacterium]
MRRHLTPSVPGPPGTASLLQGCEDLFRADGRGFSRLIWHDYDPPNAAEAAKRVHVGIELTCKLIRRNRTIITL